MHGAIIVNVVQGTTEWFRERIGDVTGTCADAMTATLLKGSGEAAPKRDLRLRLVCERLTNRSLDEGGFVSLDMQWGKDHEGDARRAYEARTGEVVETIGYLKHPELRAGCSLDGAVAGGVGIIEIKCPRSAQHLKTLRARTVLPEYLPQIQHNLFISGAAWCDFISYDPRFPPALQLVIIRVTMPQVERYAYELLLRRFLSEVDAEVHEVKKLMPLKVGTP